jgi:hypothetical protein
LFFSFSNNKANVSVVTYVALLVIVIFSLCTTKAQTAAGKLWIRPPLLNHIQLPILHPKYSG